MSYLPLFCIHIVRRGFGGGGMPPRGPGRVSGPGRTVMIFLLLFHSIKETVSRQDRVVSIT